nr:immunoglobulin heavy chain junction region [Mus musculus]
LLYSSGYSYGL